MKLVSCFLLLLAMSTSVYAQGADSLNMTLFAHVDPAPETRPHSSIWGYTAPDGREYALFCGLIGLYIYDITEQPIREVAYIAGAGGIWREAKTYGEYAYVSSESQALQIVDLSTLPDTATLVTEISEPITTAHTIYVRDHYLYAMGTAAGGAVIMDLEPDPTAPRLAGVVSRTYFHDAFVRNDTLIGAGINGIGAEIWDIRDKANPVQMALISYPESGTHNAELTTDGRYVVTSDEVGETRKTMKVWDISDLDNITRVAEFTPSDLDIIHNVHLIGRYAYVSWYTAGVRIIDMIDPANPREVAFYDTYLDPSGGYNGVWEVYAHFASGKIIASDRQSGLWVFQISGGLSSVEQPTAGSRNSLAPNPVDAGSTILVDAVAGASFELFDALGERVMSVEPISDGGRVLIPSDLAPGVYVARIVSKQGVTESKVVVR